MHSNSLLIKLMMLTTSTNDGEALTALRKANKILADAKLNWEQVLSRLEKPDNSFRVPPSRRPRPQPDWDHAGSERPGRKSNDHIIERMFNDALAKKNLSEGSKEFLESIRLWFETKGFLTDKQYSALEKLAE